MPVGFIVVVMAPGVLVGALDLLVGAPAAAGPLIFEDELERLAGEPSPFDAALVGARLLACRHCLADQETGKKVGGRGSKPLEVTHLDRDGGA